MARLHTATLVLCCTITIGLGMVYWTHLQWDRSVLETASSVEFEELISSLIDESEEGPGYSITSGSAGFILSANRRIDGALLLDGNDFHISDRMARIVRAGAPIAPFLIKHLGDSRETKITIQPTPIVASFSVEEAYDSRQPRCFFDDDALGQKSKRRRFREELQTYVVKVGDLCFVALGQIVNRQLNVAWYVPSGMAAVNSPVLSHRLRLYAAQDWAGLSKSRHCAQLVRDIRAWDNPWRTESAFKRMFYYYPAEGEKEAVRLLNRPIADLHMTETFIRQRLGPALNSADATTIYSAFIDEHGEVSREAVLLVLLQDATRGARSQHRKDRKQRSKELIRLLYPDVDLAHHRIPHVASYSYQTSLVESLGKHPSPAVDDILRTQLAGVCGNIQAMSYMVEVDDFVLACANRLKDQESQGRAVGYMKKRIDVLSDQKHLEIAENQRLEIFKDIITNLPPE